MKCNRLLTFNENQIDHQNTIFIGILFVELNNIFVKELNSVSLIRSILQKEFQIKSEIYLLLLHPKNTIVASHRT